MRVPVRRMLASLPLPRWGCELCAQVWHTVYTSCIVLGFLLRIVDLRKKGFRRMQAGKGYRRKERESRQAKV